MGGFEHSSCIPSEYPMSAVRLTTSSRKKCQSTSDNRQRKTPFLFTPYSPSVRSLSRLEAVPPHARMNSKMSSRWSISCRRHSLSNPSSPSPNGARMDLDLRLAVFATLSSRSHGDIAQERGLIARRPDLRSEHSNGYQRLRKPWERAPCTVNQRGTSSRKGAAILQTHSSALTHLLTSFT